jgi:hypothetical protein
VEEQVVQAVPTVQLAVHLAVAVIVAVHLQHQVLLDKEIQVAQVVGHLNLAVEAVVEQVVLV